MSILEEMYRKLQGKKNQRWFDHAYRAQKLQMWDKSKLPVEASSPLVNLASRVERNDRIRNEYIIGNLD